MWLKSKLIFGQEDLDYSTMEITSPPDVIWDAIKNKSIDTRLAGVAYINDQEVLKQIVKEDRTPEVQIAAINKITDDRFLASVVADTKYGFDVKDKAIQKIASSDILKKLLNVITEEILIKSVKDRLGIGRILEGRELWESVKYASFSERQSGVFSIGKSGDTELLYEIASTDSHATIRMYAIAFIKDLDKLVDIAKDNSEWRVRIFAVRKLNDQDALAEIAMEASDPSVRQRAVEKLHVVAVLQEIAASDPDWLVRVRAVENINDSAVLKFLLVGEQDDRVKTNIQDKLSKVAV